MEKETKLTDIKGGFQNFNDYTIEGEVLIIKIIKRDGSKFECIIDKEDLEKIKFIRWHVRYAPDGDNWYVVATKYIGTFEGKHKYKSIHMHSIIMDVLGKENVRVDHKNHNGLDNRKENLRLTNVIDNAKNRKAKNKNNSSGYRNVSWVQNKWIVQLQINGKNTRLGGFDNIHEAGEFAEEMRIKYYGKFKGAS